jgi:hypothetical protein
MSLLNNIKDSISDTTINNLSGYLGEDFNGTRLGLDLGINAFLASVIKFVGSEKSAKNLLNILSDGGHTGDIFNNIESFSGNLEKSKLLETIGSNIANHFFSSNTSKVGDWISDMAGIKKNSSASLLNFSAPLVLGFLGKTVREKNMNSIELKAYLYSEGEEVSAALPMSIANLLNLPNFTKAKSSPQKHNEAVSELNKDEQRKESNLGMILPWILLFLVGALIYYFASVNSKKRDLKKAEITAVSDTLHPEEFLPLDSVKMLESDSAKEDDKIKNQVEKPVITATPPPVLEKKTEPVKVETAPKKVETPRVQEKKTPVAVKISNNTPAGYSQISGGAFSKSSAEIVSKSSLQALTAQLKSSGKKITLTPLRGAGRIGEDRAYALRDFLLENGIPLSQIEISSSKTGNNESGVAFKIAN